MVELKDHTIITDCELGLWTLCSKFRALFYVAIGAALAREMSLHAICDTYPL